MPADEPPVPPRPPADVETLLREAARRRRAAFDADPASSKAMPGPMRTRLHAELARQFDAKAPAARTSAAGWLTRRWWPAWAGAVGVAAALGLFVVVPLRQRPAPTSTLAGGPKDSAAALPPAEAPQGPVVAAPAPPPSASPRPALPQTAAAPATTTPTTAPGTLAEADAPPPTADAARVAGLAKAKDAPPAVSAAILPNLAQPVRTQTFTRVPPPLAAARAPSSSSSSVAAAPVLPRAAAAARRGAGAAPAGRADDAAEATPTTVPPPAAPPPPLVGSFQFEQRGETVRVVDADGSVYVGQVQPPEADRAKAETAATGTKRAEAETRANRQSRARASENAPLQQPSPAPAEENFRFRATGDNRTLQKPVVFEGEYSAPIVPEPPGLRQQQSGANANPEAQIRGRVRVLDERNRLRDTEVDARAVRPPSAE